MHWNLPVYSGKQMLSGDLLILFSKMSFLFRKRMMDVSLNHLLLQMESNSFRDSCIRFCGGDISKRVEELFKNRDLAIWIHNYLPKKTTKQNYCSNKKCSEDTQRAKPQTDLRNTKGNWVKRDRAVPGEFLRAVVNLTSACVYLCVCMCEWSHKCEKVISEPR